MKKKQSQSKSKLDAFDSTSKHSKYSPGKKIDFGQEGDDIDEDKLLDDIELPQETLYLIDKVVRQRAKAGPIGVDNSELINIEIEDEYIQKN